MNKILGADKVGTKSYRQIGQLLYFVWKFCFWTCMSLLFLFSMDVRRKSLTHPHNEFQIDLLFFLIFNLYALLHLKIPKITV